MTQTRRQFLAASAASSLAGAAGSTRPNILVILTDQQRASMLSCAGNPFVKTPNMDRLAQSGVRFERAYVANPVCSPSRMSLLTGRMPSSIGMECNEDGQHVNVPAAMLEDGLGSTFRRAGYRTVYGGKVHLPRAGGGNRPLDNLEAFGFENISRDQRGGLAETCSAFLREKHDRPFLLFASFINPHDICYMAINAHAKATGFNAPEIPKKQQGQNSPAAYLAKALQNLGGVSEPPLPSNFEVPKNELSAFIADKREFQKWVRHNWTERDWRLHRWAYARLTEQVDREIGVVLDALRESGRERDTLVLLTSDHGDQDASHRLEHKEVLYEEATRVPFVVSWKGITKAGGVDRDHLVSNGLDLIPTLCDFASIPKPGSLHGSSVRALAEGKTVRNWRDHVVIENHLARAVHGGTWKYMVGRGAKHGETCGICPGRIKEWDASVREMCIDLEADAGEMVNRAGELERLRRGRKLLQDWHRQNGVALDPGYLL